MASTVWKGSLAFGLVSFPVRLIKAARKERVPLQYVRETIAREEEDGSKWESGVETNEAEHREQPDAVEPVRLTFSGDGDSETIPRSEIQRGYREPSGSIVVVRSEELRSLRAATSPDMEILRTVRLNEIDPVFLETSYYVVPDTSGERPYSLFYRSLVETEYAALARVSMHGRSRIMVVRPGKTGLIAHTMFFNNEVRGSEEYNADSANIQTRELDLAKRLLLAIADHFRPEEFTDQYREKLQALIASKSSVSVRDGSSSPSAETGKVVDIMQALRESLEKINDGKPRAPLVNKAPLVKKPAKAASASAHNARRHA